MAGDRRLTVRRRNRSRASSRRCASSPRRRGPRRRSLPTSKSQDADLLAARLVLAVWPGAESQRRRRGGVHALGVLDAAYDHFKAALRLEPTDAASFDGLARIWRDWGLPNLGLGDAHRAIYYAPASATVYNTLGTILLSLGQTRRPLKRRSKPRFGAIPRRPMP